MDFRSFTAIGEHLHDPSIHLKNGSGYDHNYILKKPDGKLCARVYSPTSRILLDCRTTEPGLQFYTGNFLSTANIRGKGGAVYADRSGFCLETQHFPNAMQHPLPVGGAAGRGFVPFGDRIPVRYQLNWKGLAAFCRTFSGIFIKIERRNEDFFSNL